MHAFLHRKKGKLGVQLTFLRSYKVSTKMLVFSVLTYLSRCLHGLLELLFDNFNIKVNILSNLFRFSYQLVAKFDSLFRDTSK